MKDNQLVRPTPVPTDHETVTMSIDDAGLDILMHNLTNLYSKPKEAILREYTANAWDGHVMAGGGAQPVRVSTPTANSPYLIIRDFGVGLSEDELKNVYARYGASTKRDTNKQIGAFGLGAKSALAVTDRFDIVSTKDGITNTVYVEKNERGVGVFHFVSSEITSEPNGVTVKIPMTNFVVPEDFFIGWEAGSISINGVVNDTSSVHNTDLFTPLRNGDQVLGWIGNNPRDPYSYPRVMKAEIIMGGVLYPLTDSEMTQADFPEYAQLRSYHRDVYMNLPIGSVDLTPSREGLRYTERTKKALKVALTEMKDRIPSLLNAELQKIDSHPEVIRFVLREAKGGFWGQSAFRWRGETVPESIPVADGTRWITREGTASRQKITVHSSTSGKMALQEWDSVIGSTVRVVELSGEHQNSDIVKDYKTYLEWLANTDTNITNKTLVTTTSADSSSEWAESYFERVSYDEFRAEMKQYRADVRAALKAARGGVPRAKKEVTWNVLRKDPKDDVYTVRTVNQEDLKTEEKILLVHQSHTNQILQGMFPSASQLNGQGYAFISNHKNTLSLITKYFPEYEVIFLPGQRSAEKFMASFPNAVPAASALKDKAASLVDEIRMHSSGDDILEIVRSKDYRVSAQIARLTELYQMFDEAGRLGDLSESTRKKFEELAGLSVKKPPHVALHWSGYSTKNDSNLIARANDVHSFVLRYPLLATSTNLIREEKERGLTHSLLYINGVDSLSA